MTREDIKAIIGDGKTVAGLALYLLGIILSLCGFAKEATELVDTGKLLGGIGLGHKFIKAQ